MHSHLHTHTLPYLDGVQVSGAALKGPQALPSGKLTARGNRDTQVQTDKPKSIYKTMIY